MANRTADPVLVAHTASVVVIADIVFTATAAVLQPITGMVLTWGLGWSLTEDRIALSLSLYVFIGVFWLPVVWIQAKMHDEAILCAKSGTTLSVQYRRLYRIWLACGFPAFIAIIALLWLMIAKPSISLW